jgi:hypothetical protein
VSHFAEGRKAYFATAHGEADLFVIATFTAIDRLLGLAEGRRMATLKEIERYRKALAERLRELSDSAILTGEFSAGAPGHEIGTKTRPNRQDRDGRRQAAQ